MPPRLWWFVTAALETKTLQPLKIQGHLASGLTRSRCSWHVSRKLPVSISGLCLSWRCLNFRQALPKQSKIAPKINPRLTCDQLEWHSPWLSQAWVLCSCWHQFLTLLVWNSVCGYTWVSGCSLELGPSVHSKGFQGKLEERGLQPENWRQARRRGDVFVRSRWEDAAHERKHTHMHINIHIHTCTCIHTCMQCMTTQYTNA